jgi:hypothetical protein
MAITQITNHSAQALARLKEQFKDKPKYIDLILSFTNQIQPLEDALWQLLTERAVDTAIGVQLDNLGTIVGEARNGDTDDDYRPRIRARIWVNRASGLTEELIQAVLLLVTDPDAEVEVENQYPAGVVVRLNGVAITETFADVIFSFLRDAAAAGVRLIFEHSVDDDAEMFTFARFTALDGAHLIGATTLTVDSTAGYDAAGSLILAEGTTTEETVTYTGTTPTTFTGVSALTNNQPDNSSVTQFSSPGLGFSDDVMTTLGGKFASATA